MALMMSFIFCFLMRFKSCVSAPVLQRVSSLSCMLKLDRHALLTLPHFLNAQCTFFACQPNAQMTMSICPKP